MATQLKENGMNTYQDLKDATSICTMSHETVSAQDCYSMKVREMALKVDCGLITFAEAKRAIFQA